MENLFLDLGIAKNQEELDDIFKKYEKIYDKSFITACVLEKRNSSKIWMEELWKNFSPYADKNFIKLCRQNFHSRTWEMYLANVFLEYNFKLTQREKEEGPDFKIKLPNDKVIWIEAIAGNRSTVPERNNYSGSIGVLDDPKVLRITACLKEKKEKFEKYKTDGIVDPNDICIIAINGYEFDGDLSEERLSMKALYGFHNITYNFKTKKSGNSSRPFVKNKNNSPVPVVPFLSDEYSQISAVIYCGDHIVNLPEKKMGSSFVTIHNQKAKIPLSTNLFQFGIEYIPDSTNNQVVSKVWDEE